MHVAILPASVAAFWRHRHPTTSMLLSWLKAPTAAGTPSSGVAASNAPLTAPKKSKIPVAANSKGQCMPTVATDAPPTAPVSCRTSRMPREKRQAAKEAHKEVISS
eukprot:2849073-Prymnesium_polylepis.1